MSTALISPEEYVASYRQYCADREVYGGADNRAVEVTYHLSGASPVDSTLTHDQVLDYLYGQVLATWDSAERYAHLAARMAVEHVVSDRDSGTSLASWTEPCRLVEMVLADALDVPDVELTFQPF